jgi:hypothetical protein
VRYLVDSEGNDIWGCSAYDVAKGKAAIIPPRYILIAVPVS